MIVKGNLQLKFTFALMPLGKNMHLSIKPQTIRKQQGKFGSCLTNQSKKKKKKKKKQKKRLSYSTTEGGINTYYNGITMKILQD